MEGIRRLAVFLVLATAGPVGTAWAIPITVAEFRWETIIDPGNDCPGPAVDPACVPADPFSQSIFSLTHIWNGPQPGPLLFDNRLSLPSGDFPLFDLQPQFPLNFDQLSEIGIPDVAAASISFLFGGDVVTLGATLTEPDTFAVLRFDPESASVPEPGTLALVGLGAALLVRRARVSRQSAK